MLIVVPFMSQDRKTCKTFVVIFQHAFMIFSARPIPTAVTMVSKPLPIEDHGICLPQSPHHSKANPQMVAVPSNCQSNRESCLVVKSVQVTTLDRPILFWQHDDALKPNGFSLQKWETECLLSAWLQKHKTYTIDYSQHWYTGPPTSLPSCHPHARNAAKLPNKL